MHVYYIFGLLLIFLLSVSYSMPTTEDLNDDNYWKQFDDGEDDYDDYYSEENELDDSNNNSTANRNNSDSYNLGLTATDMPIVTTNFNLESNFREPKSIEPKCPANCDCTEEFRFINCSNKNLTKIPNDLPITVMKIDLSNNLIKEINQDDFTKCIEIFEILLNNNKIEKIDKEVFTGLKKLNFINLSNNKLSTIDPDAFSEAINLSHLDLSNNLIEIPKEQSFLNAPDLEKLNLQNCSLKELYDESFYNLSNLISLSLDHNDFTKKINIKAFQPMKNLVKLKLPDLDQENISEICQILQSIDNISFKHFDLSCFELVAGSAFNESLTTVTGKSTLSVFFNKNQGQEIDGDSNAPKIKPTKSIKPTRKMKNINGNATNTLTELRINGTDEENDGVDIGDLDEHAVSISSQTINYCLFAIMTIAIIGLIIGVICRKDVFGIKTKMCRTKKARGPAPTDQVRPTEEIPLNKV